jgi:hypothetical protein
LKQRREGNKMKVKYKHSLTKSFCKDLWFMGVERLDNLFNAKTIPFASLDREDIVALAIRNEFYLKSGNGHDTLALFPDPLVKTKFQLHLLNDSSRRSTYSETEILSREGFNIYRDTGLVIRTPTLQERIRGIKKEMQEFREYFFELTPNSPITLIESTPVIPIRQGNPDYVALIDHLKKCEDLI